jgi:uncharacterized protein
MATGLLLLLDDIASIMDDVAALTKVSVQKTAGVLGDDLALNAHQVSGVEANRELPIVWAVAKGSIVNKAILIPGAVLLSSVAPFTIDPLMIVGGSYLCFEGFEKIAHQFLHSKKEDEEHYHQHLQILATEEIDVAAAEKEKINGAVRTDFILSAEIIVLTLGIVADSPFSTRLAVLVGVGILMTIGVYGLVAVIVKLDDLGMYLKTKKNVVARRTGGILLRGAPYLMKFLSVAGTVAMFLVGGGILVHKMEFLHYWVEKVSQLASEVPVVGVFAEKVSGMLMETLIGLAAGAIVLLVVSLIRMGFSRRGTSKV